MSQPPPLAGSRVVDCSHFLVGPHVGRCLAALGAEVIEVERPTKGDAGRRHPYFVNGQSGYFLQQNIRKKGLCLNMKEARGAELMWRLTDSTGFGLIAEAKSGRGQHIDLALYDCLVSMHEYAVQCFTLSGGKEVPVPAGHDLPTSTLYGVFTAKDGHPVIAAQVDAAWKRFARLAGSDAFAADARLHSAAGRNEHRLEILPLVRAWVAQLTLADALAQLEASDVTAARVQRIDEVLADPQIAARGMVIEQQHPVLGMVKLPNLPFRLSECDTTCRTPAPLLGQHNREVASMLGYSPGENDAMARDGVLYSEPQP